MASTHPRYGGTLRMEIEGDPLQAPDGMAWPLVLDGLTDVDSQGNVVPSLGLRWSSDNDGHRWQFWLRPGVSFQDAHPLNAMAVVSSLEESCRVAACPWTALHVSGQSVVFTADDAMPNLPALLTAQEFLIRRKLEGGGEDAASIVGTGAFRIKSASAGGVMLEANDDCWQGRPFADAVEIVGHRSARDMGQDLSLNKADVIELHAAELRQAHPQAMRAMVSSNVTLLALQIDDASLAPQLRAAIAFAVDRAALSQVIFQKQGEVTASLLPNSLTGYSFLFPSDRDLTHALAIRGGLASPPLTLSVEGNAAIQLAGERLALNLRDAGFMVRVNSLQRADLKLREAPLSGGSQAAALEGMLRQFGVKAPVTAIDPTGVYKAEREFLEQHTVIPLVYLPRAWGVAGRVRDLHLTAGGVPDIADTSLYSSGGDPGKSEAAK